MAAPRSRCGLNGSGSFHRWTSTTARRSFWSQRTRTTRRWASAPPRRLLGGRGITVQVVAVTDGEAAYPDDSGGREGTGEGASGRTRRRGRCDSACRSRYSSAYRTGRWRAHEQLLVDKIGAVLAGFERGTWCAATWRGDGHPDHEATGRAAAAAAKNAGAPFIEYPIWMWHWASPDDPAVPWHRARRLPRDTARTGDEGRGDAVLLQPTGAR